MNILIDSDSANSGTVNRRDEPPGCGLDCKEELFGNLANHSQLCILQTLREGAKTVSQIAGATSLSQIDVSNHLEALLDCGCVKAEDAGDSVLYGLSAPRLLQLEGIVDEMLIAALKGHRVYD
jgi:DNA-binding transcriptional ArsR family regulator